MDGAASARTGQQPADDHAAAPRLAIVLGRHDGSGRVGRVEAPGRVLRMWSLLNNAEEELHRVRLPMGAEARLGRQLETVTAELERSVSPILAGELRRLVGRGGTVPLTLAELRVDYAGVLGWTGGLVIAMLDQLATAPARLADQSTAPGSLPEWVVTGTGEGHPQDPASAGPRRARGAAPPCRGDRLGRADAPPVAHDRDEQRLAAGLTGSSRRVSTPPAGRGGGTWSIVPGRRDLLP
jgi:hypothetical protein